MYLAQSIKHMHIPPLPIRPDITPTQILLPTSKLEFLRFKRNVYPLSRILNTIPQIFGGILTQSDGTYNIEYQSIFLNYYIHTNQNTVTHYITKTLTSLISQDATNIVVFTQPKKQLFIIIFKTKPIFIFTGGLMRIVINERRKSSKRSYKVAMSLIKLAIILLQTHFSPVSGNKVVLKINLVNKLRYKILATLFIHRLWSSITSVITSQRSNPHAQKLATRRAVKKYIKKRFK